MNYFEYCIAMDKLDVKFDLSLMNEDIYQESVSSFFNKLTNALIDYIDDCRYLHYLYKGKRKLDKGLKYLSNACKDENVANQIINVRGYNGKWVNPLTMNDVIHYINNLMAYTKLKITDRKISEYLEKYELYKGGWDVFYEIKLKDVPSACESIDKILIESIDDLKTSLKKLSSYYENASDEKRENENKNIFKDFIYKIKSIIKRDINIVTMTFEIMKYEVNKKFSKLVDNTSDKVVYKKISDKRVMKDSKFIKEITYGTDVYKVYESEHKDVLALNYGGSLIYVNNGFFTLPKGYQLAILYHEIGHHQCKHFSPQGFKSGKINDGYDIPMEDVEKLAKRIRKDYSKFLSKVLFSPYGNMERYRNGEEFLYLLVEWEADRFAANNIGKYIMRKALTNNFSDSLKKSPMYKNPEKEKANYDFNMDRMRIRTTNI